MTYSNYVAQLFNASGEILLRCFITTFVGSLLWFAGSWLPALASRQGPAKGEPVPQSPWSCLALGLGGGAMTGVACWTASLYLFKSAALGSVAVFAIAVICMWRFRKQIRTKHVRHGAVVLTVTSLIAVMLGVWQQSGNELPTDSQLAERGGPPTELYLYTDRHGDLPVHLHNASLVGDSGLPRIDTNGLPGRTHSSLVHTGYSALLAGVHSFTGATYYQLATSMWLLAYLLIVWSALTLVEELAMPGWLRVVAAVGPLVWGPIGVPFSNLALKPVSAGLMFHNFPQVWSVAVGGVAIVCFQRYVHAKTRDTPMIAAAAAAIAISGLIKPSLAILFGPALLLSLLLLRARLRDLGIVLGLLTAGAVCGMLPALVADLPKVRGFAIAPDWPGTKRVLHFLAMGGGIGLVVVYARVRALATDVAARKVGWSDLVILATGGGALFAVLFREVRMGDFQPNLLWGACGALTFFATAVVAWCGGAMQYRTSTPAWLRRFGAAVLALHLLNGLTYAVAYPVSFNARYEPIALATVFAKIGDATIPTTRFLIDPMLMGREAFSQLRRPVLSPRIGFANAAQQEWDEWVKLCTDGVLTRSDQLAKRDALIIVRKRVKAREMLSQVGWTRAITLGGVELWIDPKRPEVLTSHGGGRIGPTPKK
jgi:hypothetical protein